ncbi:MAG: hypothetical protein IPK63_19590 [Candidatus Competibacteraceae bacterium]|nr:hypothetical protein [Candidatus Competibacteraceae bacterium]
MTVIRNGKQQDITVALGRLPDKDQPELALSAAPDDGSPRLDIAVSGCAARRTRPRAAGGVLIQQVGPGVAARPACGPVTFTEPQQSENQGCRAPAGRWCELPRGKRVPLAVKRGSGSLYLAVGNSGRRPATG